MVKVVAKSVLKEGIKDKVLTMLDEMIEKTRQEDGCIQYELFEDVNDPNSITFIEEWESKERLDAHMNSEHFKRIIPALDEYKEKPIPVEIYKKIK